MSMRKDIRADGATLTSQYKELSETIEQQELALPADQSIYDALRERGLLADAWLPSMGKFVVPDGCLGQVLNNGRPLFLAPGRHTMWSPFAGRREIVPITKDCIELGSIQIVTVNQGELALSTKNGINIILDPGRYILESPHRFVKRAQANQSYIELGTHRRITVPAGYVAIAYDNGKQIIISENDTKDGPYITDSPTFLFNVTTGFQSIQLQSKRIDELTVNTKDGIPIKVEGLINYEIINPNIAFLKMKDVHETIVDQAESTLTMVFSHLTMKDIAPSLSAHEEVSLKGKEKSNGEEDNEKDLITKATKAFLGIFNEKADSWGVKLTLNIEKMEFVDKQYTDTIRSRAQQTVAADIATSIVAQTNDVERQKAENAARLIVIDAQAKAEAKRILADADTYAAQKSAEAAKLLQESPLAAELAAIKAQGEALAKCATAGSTIFMPNKLMSNSMAYRANERLTLFSGSKTKNLGTQAKDDNLLRRSLTVSS